MRRSLIPLAILLAAAAPAAGDSRLDPLAAPVAEKRAGATGKDAKTLDRVARLLGRADGDLLRDLGLGKSAAGLLDRRFPTDPLLDPPLQSCWTDLRQGAQAERAALAAWAGRTRSTKGEGRLDRGLERADLRLAAGDAAPARATAAKQWRLAVKTLRKTRRSLHLSAPPLAPPPFQGLAPDFSLADENPNSPGYLDPVSPRDGLGFVTAWYFTRVT